MKVKILIQMYYADEFNAVVNQEEFEKQLKNAELGYTIFVHIVDVNGQKIKFNPKYVAYIKYKEVV